MMIMLFTIGFNAILRTKVGDKFLFVYNEQIKEKYIYIYYNSSKGGTNLVWIYFFFLQDSPPTSLIGEAVTRI